MPAREITRLHALGNSVREIADQVRLSKSVVGRFVRERGLSQLRDNPSVPATTHTSRDFSLEGLCAVQLSQLSLFLGGGQWDRLPPTGNTAEVSRVRSGEKQ